MYETHQSIALGIFACSLALWKPASERSRLRTAWGFLTLWLAIRLTIFLPVYWLPEPAVIREVTLALIELAAVQVVVVATFDLILRRANLPKFASEMLIAGGYAAIVFNLFYKLGVNVTGIFATSAVAAAVVGLALQDMLSNIASGVALELEGGIHPGDFIRCGDFSGWVRHVRLRHTALSTPDGDIVILPNSQLTRTPVSICRSGHRQFIPFAMPYQVDPREVIETVEFALRVSPLPDIAAEPAPRCVIQKLTPNHIDYAAIVWLSKPGHDTLSISEVYTRLCFALRRAGIPAGEISHVIEMKTGTPANAESLDPVGMLRRTPILRLLEDADLFELGSHLHHLSFAPGEYIIRQGDTTASMYFIVAGQVGIVFRAADGAERDVSITEAGDFFGEASLLTGETRNASAVARSKVDCYRLDKAALGGLMARRPELAEDMSVVMAHRQTELAVVKEKLDRETALLRESADQVQLLARIRRFFGTASQSAGV